MPGASPANPSHTDPGTPVALPPVVLRPFRIGCDWLTLSMRGPVSMVEYTEAQPWKGPDGQPYTWMPVQGPAGKSRIHDRIFYLLDEHGEKVMTIAGKPSSKINEHGPEWMLVQFAVGTLYRGGLHNWHALYRQLLEMGFVYLSVSRIDIAADGIADQGGDFMEAIQRTWGGSLDYYGKANWQPNFSRKKVTGATLGSRAGNKFVRCYNKSRELKSVQGTGKRDVIGAAWASALGGINPIAEEMTVNRLEVQLKGKEVRRYFPEEQERDFPDVLAEPGRMVDIYESTITSIYDFRRPAARSRDAAPGIQWDFSAVAEAVDSRARKPRTVGIGEVSMKVTIRNTWLLAMTSQDAAMLAMCEQMASTMMISRWYQDAQVRWYKLWHKLWNEGDERTVQVLQRALQEAERNPDQ